MVTKPSHDHIRQSVKLEARILDNWDVSWPSRINLNTLDMATTNKDVAGQLRWPDVLKFVGNDRRSIRTRETFDMAHCNFFMGWTEEITAAHWAWVKEITDRTGAQINVDLPI